MIALLYMRDLPPGWKERAVAIEVLLLGAVAVWMVVARIVSAMRLRLEIRRIRKEEEEFDALWEMRQSDWARHEDR